MTVGHGERHGKVVVVGQGYVGLPLAMRTVEVGFDVRQSNCRLACTQAEKLKYFRGDISCS